MDLNYGRSVGDTRTREPKGPYISKKDHVEYSPWADWERRNKTSGPNGKQASLSDLFGNRWRHDAFDGLREAHEAGGLYNKRLKFTDPSPPSANDAPPSSGSGSLRTSSRSIHSVQRDTEQHCYPSRRSIGHDYHDSSLRVGMSKYPGSSQEYEDYDSEGYSTDEYEPQDFTYSAASGMENAGLVSHHAIGKGTNHSITSRKMGIPGLLCPDKPTQRSIDAAGSHRTGPIRPWETSSNSSPVVLSGTKSANGSMSLTSPHDGYAPYETRETTQNTSTHDSNTVQSSASTDIRPPGLRHASYLRHEANQSFSRTPTPEPHESMYDYASCPSSPIITTYLPHYDYHRLPSPDPYNRTHLLSHTRTRPRSQDRSKYKRPSPNNRSRSPSYITDGYSRNTAEPSGHHLRLASGPTQTSDANQPSHSRQGFGAAIFNVERRAPIPISRDFHPPGYRPDHLFRVVRHAPPLHRDKPKSMHENDPSRSKVSTSNKAPPPAPSPHISGVISEPPTPPFVSTPLAQTPCLAINVPKPSNSVCQTTLELAPGPQHPSPRPPEPPNPHTTISHYRSACTLDKTSAILDTTREMEAAPTYYRPTPSLPVTAPVAHETQEAEQLEGSDTGTRPNDPSEKKARQRKPTKRAPGEFSCGFCEKTFTRNFDLLRHQKTIHQNPQPVVRGAQTCPDCHNYFNRRDAYSRHLDKRPGSCFKALNLRASAQFKAQAPEPVQAILRKKSKAS